MSGSVRLSCYFIMKHFKKFKVTPKCRAAYLRSCVSRCSSVRSAFFTLCSSLIKIQQFQFPFGKINPETVRSCDISLRNTWLLKTSWKRNKQINAMRKKKGTTFIHSLRKTRERKKPKYKQLTYRC